LLHQVYTSLDRPDAAEAAGNHGVERAEREFARNPENPRPAYLIATTLAKLGDKKRAEAWAKTALAIAPDDFLTQYNIACYYSVSDQADRAFDLLERLLPVSNAEMRDWILIDSDFDPLHGDARWQKLKDVIEQR
ncbi:MAG: adenylate/guanylate cyclase domain-containing protein, partial [Alphaproteobacteria bacterium]|nr:adenylate/guanylate cyclase domain-containing protein [Alphaproteobacteria bacterium]